jgi:hypothetical protein
VRLVEALEQTPTGALRRVASAHGLAHDDSTTRAELIERIAERLGDPTYLGEQLSALPRGERAVLASARASEGELRGALIDQAAPGVAEDLAERGWLYRVFTATGLLRGEVFVVPDELLLALPSLTGAGEESLVESIERAAGAFDPRAGGGRRSSDPAFNVFALVSALTRSGGHLEQEVRSWSEEPGGWAWELRWTLLRQLAELSGLLVHRPDGALGAGPGLERLLNRPALVANRLWRAYLRDAGWSELVQAGLVGASAERSEYVDNVALRRSIVELVQGLPENGWLALDGVLSWLAQARPTIVREQLTPRGLAHFQSAEWQELEAPLLRFFMLGPLYWLGVLAVSRDGGGLARRTSRDRDAPAADTTRTADPAGDDAEEPCTWDGLELVAPARVALGTLLQLEPYLVLTERGRRSRYHLHQAHLAAALASGGSIAECRALLGRLTQGPLPTTVDEHLGTWERRFGALTVRPAVLLEAQTAEELSQVLSDERIRPFTRARLSPSVAEVAAADALQLALALRESGHLPRVDAALRLAAEPRQAYAGLVDEQVLEFLLVSLLAFQLVRPERLAELEGSQALLERLEHQFPPERRARLRTAAEQLAGTLQAAPGVGAGRRRPQRRRRRGAGRPGSG